MYKPMDLPAAIASVKWDIDELAHSHRQAAGCSSKQLHAAASKQASTCNSKPPLAAASSRLQQ